MVYYQSFAPIAHCTLIALLGGQAVVFLWGNAIVALQVVSAVAGLALRLVLCLVLVGVVVGSVLAPIAGNAFLAHAIVASRVALEVLERLVLGACLALHPAIVSFSRRAVDKSDERYLTALWSGVSCKCSIQSVSV